MKPVLVRLVLSALLFSGAFCWQRTLHAQAQTAELVVVSAATLQPGEVAIASLASVFGQRLATTTAVATDTDPNEPGVQLPIVLGGTTVRVDGQLAQLLFVSPNQINFRVPDPATQGSSFSGYSVQIEVLAGDGTRSVGELTPVDVAPGFFTANGSGAGLPVGLVVRVRANGTQTVEPLFTNQNGSVVPKPVDWGAANERIFLTLFTTGLRNVADPNGDDNLRENVRVLMNSYEVIPTFVGSAPGLRGVEQINVELPRTFLGLPKVTLTLEVLGDQFVPEFKQPIEIPLALPTLGALTWQPAALAGKPVLSLASSEMTTLAGTNDGVYYTALGKNDWKASSYGLPGVRRTTALLPQGFLAGQPAWLSATDGSGVWFTGNEGIAWTAAASAENSLLDNVKTLAFGLNTDFIFVGTDNLGVVRARRFVQGSRWERASAQFTSRVQALATNGSRVLAGTAANGLYLSNDNGNTWTQNANGIPANAEIRALLRAGNTFFAGAAGGLFRSTDNGASWTRLTDGVPGTAAINTLYAYGQAVLAGTASDGVLVSNDGGTRWQTLSAGLAGQSVLSLAQSGTRLLAGTSNGVYAATLTEALNQPPVALAQEVTLDEDTSKAITLRGTDAENNALTYSVVRGPQRGELTGSGANLVYTPEPDFFGEDQFEFRVNNGKVGSLRATVKLIIKPVNDPPQMTISGDRLMLTGQFVNLQILLSDPDILGFTGSFPLTLTATGLPTGARLSPVPYYSTVEYQRLVWVPETAGIYTMTFTVTDDSALTASQTVTLRVADNPEKGRWTELSTPVRPQRADYLTNLLADGTDLYAAMNQESEIPSGLLALWRSTDGGATWKAAGQGLNALAFPNALVRQGNQLFLGTSVGLYRSLVPGPDGVLTWTLLSNGLPENAYIRDLAVRDNRLVLITGQDVFLSTDQGNHWTRITSNLPLPAISPQFPLYSYPTAIVFSGEALFVSLDRYAFGLAGGDTQPEPASAETATDAEAQAALAGVFRSTDNGVTWQAVNKGLLSWVSSGPAITGLTVSGSTLYAQGNAGLFRSTNQGDLWQQVPTPPLGVLLGIPTGAAEQAAETEEANLAPTQIVFSGVGVSDFSFAASNGKLYLAPYGRGVYTSPESGSDWLPINLGLNDSYLSQLLLAGNRLYAITYTSPGIFVNARPSARLFVRSLAGN